MVESSARLDELRNQLSHSSDKTHKNLAALIKLVRCECIFSDNDFYKLLKANDPDQTKVFQDKLSRYCKRHKYAPSSTATYRSRLRQLTAYYKAHFATDEPESTAPLGQRLIHHARQEWGSETQQQLLGRLHAGRTRSRSSIRFRDL